MKLGRKLTWDPAKEEFVHDAEANALRARTPRSARYDLAALLKKPAV